MRISRNDPFDPTLCIRGLSLNMTYIHADIYEYMYYLTFKRTMKSYAKDFKNAWVQTIEHNDFFDTIDDRFVKNCRSVEQKLIKCKLELNLRFGIDEEEDLIDEVIISQSERFRPYHLKYIYSKNYKKLRLYYERTLAGFIESLYLHACAFTAQSNKIPLVLKRQFALPEHSSLRLLNQDDDTVALLKNLIEELKKDLTELRLLIMGIK